MIFANEEFGIAPVSAHRLRQALAHQPGLIRAWMYGSRATGACRQESDIDLAVEAPAWTGAERMQLLDCIGHLGLLYRVDVVFLDQALPAALRSLIERDKRLFWERSTEDAI